MRLIHRYVVHQDQREQFLQAGVDFDEYQGGRIEGWPYVIFEIDESDSRWPRVSSLSDGSEIVRTEFSGDELRVATFVGVQSTSVSGYPEPSDDNGYLDVTFDLTDYCDRCGIGRRQKAPFRMIREVKWGRRTTTQLNWIWDELFVRPDTWDQVFEPFGVACEPVNSKKGTRLDSVVQIMIDSRTDLDIPPDYRWTDCPNCGRRKYLPCDRGPWPKPMNPSDSIFRSNEYFGDGGEAYQKMFISNALYEKMASAKLNCNYWVCNE